MISIKRERNSGVTVVDRLQGHGRSCSFPIAFLPSVWSSVRRVPSEKAPRAHPLLKLNAQRDTAAGVAITALPQESPVPGP